jgi:mono/diheme cytochrome c family protein
MVHGDEGWAGYTYVWDARQKEAELIDDRQRRTIAGKPWTFPGRGDCMNCHTHAAGYVLGWKPGQLGGQLDGLVHAGYFATPVASQPAWDRKDARAYLDANCAHCHQPNGPGNASIDLRHEIPTDKMKVVGVPAALAGAGRPEGNIVTPGKPEASALWLRMKDTSPLGMPPLAHNVVDPHGLAIVAAWIRGLPAPPPAASPGQ